MADNIGDQFSNDLSKLSEQVNKLVTALGSVTKDSTDSLNQMKKQIQLCTSELLNMESVSGGANDGLKSLRQQLDEATKKYNAMVAENTNNGKLLEKIMEESNDTGEQIGELLRTEKNTLEYTRGIHSNSSAQVKLGEKEAEARAEDAREKKAGGKGGAEHLGRDTGHGKHDKEGSKEKADHHGGAGEGSLLGIFRGFRLGLLAVLGSIAGFLSTFVPGMIRSFLGLFTELYNGIRGGAKLFVNSVFEIGGMFKKLGQGFFGKQSLFGELGSYLVGKLKTGLSPVFESFAEFRSTVGGALKTKIIGFASEVGSFFKFIGSSIAKPFISIGKDIAEMATFVGGKLLGFFREVDSFVQFATKPLSGITTRISGMFGNLGKSLGVVSGGAEGGIGILSRIGSFFQRIGKFFIGGEQGIAAFSGAFQSAAKMGSKIASKIPFIALIPTIIDTIVSAFSKFQTEGLKGVFKSVIVGLLKGVAAFFTFGLSDLAIDFDKLFDALSKPLDGIFDQVMGMVKILQDVFGWIMGAVMQVWNDFLQPVIMSLWDNALKPIVGAIEALADVVFKVVAFIFKLLTPVFALLKFIFKIIFEVVKVIFDWVVMPILKVLAPIFKVVFSIIGWLFETMRIGFEYISIGFEAVMEFVQPLLDGITKFFDDGTDAFDYLGQMVSDFMQPIVDMFSWLGGMISEVWTTLVGKFKPLLSWLGIDMGPDTRSTRGMTPSVASGAMASSAAASPADIQSAATRGGAAAHSTVMVTHAPTTNNVVNGGGGGGAPVVLSPNPVRHADSTRHMIGH